MVVSEEKEEVQQSTALINYLSTRFLEIKPIE